MEQDIKEALRSIEALLAAMEKRSRPDLPLVLTRKEAGRLLSVGATTINAMLKRGEIAPTQVRGRDMIPTSEVIRIAMPRQPKPKPKKKEGRAKRGPPDKGATGREAAARARARIKKL